jgi:hypothetical protein
VVRDGTIEVSEFVVELPGPTACTGEAVLTSMRTEFRVQTLSGPGGKLHITAHLTDRGSTGVGTVTGAQYRVINSQAEAFTLSAATGQSSDTAVFSRRFISRGSMPNFHVHNTFHVTVSPDGKVSVEFDRIDRSCVS